MKKHYLKLLSFFLCFFLTFSFLGSYSFCFASSVSSTSPFGDFNSFHTPEETWDFCSHYMLEIVDAVTGLIPQVGHTEFAAHFRDTIRRNKQFENETECYEWMQDGNLMIDKPDDVPNFTKVYFSDEFLSILRDAVETYKADCDAEQVFYWRQIGCPSDYLQASSFVSVSDYLSTKEYLQGLCNKHDYVYCVNPGGSSPYNCSLYICIGMSVSQCVVINDHIYPDFRSFDVINGTSNYDNDYPFDIYFYSPAFGKSTHYTSWKDFDRYSINVFADVSGNNPHYFLGDARIPSDHRVNFAGNVMHHLWETYSLNWLYRNSSWAPFIMARSQQYIRSFKDRASALDFYAGSIRPGYYTHDPTLSGNTITAQQLNNGVNYGDIVGGDKNIIIIPGPGNPITIPNPDPGSGGGGGGGGTIPNPDPGSGGWDFSGLLRGLMTLIQSIFNLISSLVGYIAELLGELITTITGLIDRLKLLVTGGVMELFTAFFPWLPPEVASLISLSFLLGVIIAIIKFIRG